MSGYSKRRTQIAKLKDALRAVSELAADLPSRDDLTRADSSLAELVHFIESARKRLAHVPSVDDVGSITQVVTELQNFLERAEASPALSLALGLEVPPRRLRRRPESAEATVSTEEVARRFDDLTIDQVRDKLADEHQTAIADLRGIAKSVGARTGSRVGRNALVANIVTKVTNLRGYRSLGPASQSQIDKKGHT